MKRVVTASQNATYTIQLSGNELQLLRVAIQELMPRVSESAASQLKKIEDQLKSTLK